MLSLGFTNVMAFCKCGHEASIDVLNLPSATFVLEIPAKDALYRMRRPAHASPAALARLRPTWTGAPDLAGAHAVIIKS